MRALAHERRQTRLHGHGARLPLGDRVLPAPGSLGAGEGALRTRVCARRDEQPHHLDALLSATRVLSRVPAVFHARTPSRTVRARAAALPYLDARTPRASL